MTTIFGIINEILQYIWRLRDKNSIEENYPITIKQMFPTLPKYVDRIDAAYERPDGMILLFTGKI